MKKNNILIVEDHQLTRFGLKTSFESVEFVKNIYEASHAQKAFEILKNNKIDLVLMDLGLPDVNGIEATKKIRQLNNSVKIVILTSHNDEKEVLESLKAGANAYCSKEINPQRLTEVVESVLDGASWFDPNVAHVVLSAISTGNVVLDVKTKNDYNLTSREEQILKLITEGFSNNQIAKELGVSINTTKAHVASILQKLNVDDRLQAALKALRNNIV